MAVFSCRSKLIHLKLRLHELNFRSLNFKKTDYKLSPISIAQLLNYTYKSLTLYYIGIPKTQFNILPRPYGLMVSVDVKR